MGLINGDKPRVLIVDDTPENIKVLQAILAVNYTIQVAIRGERALRVAAAEPAPDIILLDIMMPEMDGYEVCTRLKKEEKTKNIPVIFLSALEDESSEARGLELGAVDYVSKPFSPMLLQARIRNQLELKMHRDRLTQTVAARTQELELTQEVTVESLGILAEFRDQETGQHIKRTKIYTRLLARHLCTLPHFAAYLSENMIDRIYISSPLHDIGKVGVPDYILKKTGKLTPEEYTEIKNIHSMVKMRCKFRRTSWGKILFWRWRQKLLILTTKNGTAPAIRRDCKVSRFPFRAELWQWLMFMMH